MKKHLPKVINALNRFAYLGSGVSFPAYCEERGYSFNREVYGKLLADRPIVRIEECRIPVGELKTRLFGTTYKMSDALPYKAMCGEVEYSEYTDKLKGLTERSSFERGENYAAEILAKLKNEGFDPKCPIIVNNKNLIIDGQHRSCSMLHLFGPDYRIPALRIYTLPISGSFLGRLFGIKLKTYPLRETVR